MPYIGKSPVGGGFHKLDNLTASATATYALTLGSAAYYPETANQLLVSLNGVIQAPQDSFTVSGSNLVFDSALTASDSIDFVVALGDVLGVGSVTDGAITTAKLGNGAVTDAKIDTMAASKLTGALPAIDGSSLTNLPIPTSDYVKLATINDTTSASTFTWSMDYTGYSNFIIFVENITGSSSTGRDLRLRLERDGVITSGNNYHSTASKIGISGYVNSLNTSNILLNSGAVAAHKSSGTIHCANFGSDGFPTVISNLCTADNTTLSSTHSMNVLDATTHTKITGMRLAYSTGNVTTVKLKIYGVKD